MEDFIQILHIVPKKNLKVKIHGKILLVTTAADIQRLGLFFLQMNKTPQCGRVFTLT